MKNKYMYARIFYTVFTVFAALAASAGLTLLYLKNADLVDIDGVYTSALLKNNGFTAAIIAFSCCAVAILALSFLVYRKADKPTTENVPKNLSVFLNAACGLFVLATAVMQFVLKTENTPYQIKTLGYIMALLAIPASLYFLWPALSGKCPKGPRMFFGIALAAWLCCTALALHFFMLDFLNSPTRVVSMLSCCFLILFVLSDVRLDTPGLYVPLGLVAAFFAIPDGASKLVLSFTRQAGFSPNISAFYALCRFALGVYALISVICYLWKAKDAPSKDNVDAGAETPLPDQSNGEAPDGDGEEAEESTKETEEDGEEEEPREDDGYADLAATVELPDTGELKKE